VELHPLARQFASVADAYERGRPEYGPAVIGATAAELGIRPGDRVLDLAAGTGKLTRALVAYGFDVVAVEPQAPLRAVLGDKVPAALVLDGVAEQIPVEDRSVAAVMIADGFHWFDRPRALVEIRRVLAPGGGLALLNTVPDWSGASWAHELGTLVAGTRPEHPHFDGRAWQEFVREAGGFAAPWELRVTTYRPADPEQVLAHMASMSWIAGLAQPQRADVLARMRAIVSAGQTPDQFPLHVEIGLTTLLRSAPDSHRAAPDESNKDGRGRSGRLPSAPSAGSAARV
jgi:SAM-dependent methyltransferase